MTVGGAVLQPSNILKIPEIASAVTENVKTDLSTSQILWIGHAGHEDGHEAGCQDGDAVR